MYKFENEENRPDNCEECVEFETCATYYASSVCQKKWKKGEALTDEEKMLKELLWE